MKIKDHTLSVTHFAWGRRQAFTMLEVLIASLIGSVLIAVLMTLTVDEAREQRIGMIQQLAFEEADHIEDRCINLIKAGSRQSGVVMGNPVGSSYRQLIFRVPDGGGGFVASSLTYDPDRKRLTYLPNTQTGAGAEELVKAGDQTFAKLDDVRFSTGLQNGNIPDSGIILVSFQVSDHGYARQTHARADNPASWITSTRSFAVNLRRQ